MAYKWWRIKNIVLASDNTTGVYKLHTLILISRDGVLSDNILRSEVESIDEGDINNLFDDSDSYITSGSDKQGIWWFSYNFERPVVVSKIKIRGDSTTSYIKSFDMEYSVDGITWSPWHENIQPHTSYNSDSYIVNLPRITLCSVPTASTQNTMRMVRLNRLKSITNVTTCVFMDGMPIGSSAIIRRTSNINNIYKYMTGNVLPLHSNVTIVNGNSISVLTMPTLVGKGTIQGSTYEGDSSILIDSDVYASPKMHPSVKKYGSSNDGSFSIDGLNTNILYDVFATPTDGRYQTKIASNITPIDNNKNYMYDAYALHDKNMYQGVEYNIQISTVDSKGDKTYALSGDASGATIDTNGIVKFVRNAPGPVAFKVDVSDNELAVTKSVNIVGNVNSVTRTNIPLTINGTDTTNVVWDNNGDVNHIHGWGKFINNAYYSNNMSLQLSEEFSLSFTFVKYSFYDSTYNNGSILSGGVHSDFSNMFNVYLRSHDRKAIFFINNVSHEMYTSIKEYKRYSILYACKNNVLSLYINGILNSNIHISTSDMSIITSAIQNPIRIGNNTNRDGSISESFGGIIKDVNIVNGYMDKNLIKTVSNQSNYIIVPSNNAQTNYYELPLINTTVYNETDSCLTFNDSQLVYTGNSLNMLAMSSYELSIKFSVTSFGSTGNAYLIGTVNKDSNSKQGWCAVLSTDGIRIETNYGEHYIKFAVELNTKYTFKIQFRENIYIRYIINDKEILYYNGPYIIYDTSTNFSIGNSADYDAFYGDIYSIKIVDYYS